jgi:hypothetical protein
MPLVLSLQNVSSHSRFRDDKKAFLFLYVNSSYKTRDEFAADARRVFVNCELFNEDDSSVGRAGHVMYEFFEKRWAQLTGGSTGNNDTT